MTADTLRYVNSVSPEHRRAFGQFFTHPIVDEFMVNWVLDSGVPRVYDPAYGLGAFDPCREDVSFSASEIDPRILSFRNESESRSRLVVHEDYLASWGKKHSNIVCNPPYMRFQKFINRDAISQEFQRHIDIRLSGYTNIASAFLIKSLSELDGSGRLAYIMPLEFLNTGYGKIVKERLVENRHLHSILSIECEKDVFPDAITSVGIVLYDARQRFPSVRFCRVRALHELQASGSLRAVTEVKYDELDPGDKWLQHFREEPVRFDSTQLVPLAHYGRFSRGIATGANEFFVLTSRRARMLGLRHDEIAACITRSSQITHPTFTQADFDRLNEREAPVWLFSANTRHLSEGASQHVQSGETQGYNERFLTKSRKPWYRTEHRRACPILLGVFSRGGYKVIRNHSSALNLTCYHGFQPNLFGQAYVDHLFLFLLSKAGRGLMESSMRKYGDSLGKFEPNDLNDALVPSTDAFDVMPRDAIANAMKTVRDTGQVESWVEATFERLQLESTSAVQVATSA